MTITKETPDELRLRLKNERAAQRAEATRSEFAAGSDTLTTSSSSRDTIEYSPDFGGQDQRDERLVPGLHNGVRGTKRTTGDTQRKLDLLAGGIAQINQRKRPANRRSGEDHSQDRPDGTDVPASVTGRSSRSTRSVGNLETTEPIPPRNFDLEREAAVEDAKVEGTPPARKRGRPPKRRDPQLIEEVHSSPPIEEGPNFIQRFIKGGKTLSEREARELKPSLTSALQDEFLLLDKMLWSMSGDPLQQPIWSDTSDKEIEAFTSSFLKLGQKSPAVASVARIAVDASDYTVAAAMIGPRFLKTVDVVKQVRKQNQRNVEHSPKRSTLDRLRSARARTAETAHGEGYRGI